jgi:hypothetical protein
MIEVIALEFWWLGLKRFSKPHDTCKMVGEPISHLLEAIK